MLRNLVKGAQVLEAGELVQEVALFALPFMIAESRQERALVQDDRRIRGKNHVRQPRRAVDHDDPGPPLVSVRSKAPRTLPALPCGCALRPFAKLQVSSKD